MWCQQQYAGPVWPRTGAKVANFGGEWYVRLRLFAASGSRTDTRAGFPFLTNL